MLNTNEDYDEMICLNFFVRSIFVSVSIQILTHSHRLFYFVFTMNQISLIFLAIFFISFIEGNSIVSSYKKKRIYYRNLLRKATGTVRLVTSNSKNNTAAGEGNVEIFYAGKWGSLCDDEWDINEGQVVCRQLGYSQVEFVTTSSKYGPSNTKGLFWMKDVFCDGTEKRLPSCRFENWVNEECKSSEVAGVKCLNKIPPKILEMPSKSTLDKSKMMLRLSGGRHKLEGRIEVKFDSGEWGSICPDGWSIVEANVVCKHLGLGYGEKF